MPSKHVDDYAILQMTGKVDAHLSMFKETDISTEEKNDIRHKLAAYAKETKQNDEQVDTMLGQLADILSRIRTAQGTLETPEQAGIEENRALAHVMQAASHVTSCDDAVRHHKQATAAAAKAAARGLQAVSGTSEDEEVSRYEAIAVAAAKLADDIHTEANTTTMKVGEVSRELEVIQRRAERGQIDDDDYKKVEKSALEAVKYSCSVAQLAKSAREAADKASAAQNGALEMLHLSGHTDKFEDSLGRIQKAVDNSAGNSFIRYTKTDIDCFQIQPNTWLSYTCLLELMSMMHSSVLAAYKSML